LHQLEANILVPKIMERNVGVSPVAVMVALAHSAARCGADRAPILAIPTAAIISVINRGAAGGARDADSTREIAIEPGNQPDLDVALMLGLGNRVPFIGVETSSVGTAVAPLQRVPELVSPAAVGTSESAIAVQPRASAVFGLLDDVIGDDRE